MKNITLSAEEDLIAGAREVARIRKSSFNQLFREWLSELVKQREREERLKNLEERTQYARSGGPFTRGEMNER